MTPFQAGTRPAGESSFTECLFHVVLHRPQIPNNTGNIGRTCVATGCALHLIHPLGFRTDAKACRRAGLDYWPRLRVREHAIWDTYLSGAAPPRLWMFTTKTARSYFDAEFHPGDHLVFGSEDAGLPGDLLGAFPDQCLRMPMVAGERSLNLATAVCAVVYEGIRQVARQGQVRIVDGMLIPPTPENRSARCEHAEPTARPDV